MRGRRIPDFASKVYSAAKRIKRGSVATYKDVAEAIGRPGAYRAVGNALNRNCDTSVPCHRVVRSDFHIGGFNKGRARKSRILASEGVRIKGGLVLDAPGSKRKL